MGIFNKKVVTGITLPSGDKLYTGSKDEHVRIWDCASGQVKREFHLPTGDFPNVEHFREVLRGYNFDKFKKLKPQKVQAVYDMLGYDIPG
ncbi:EH domain-containing protein 2-like [Beta vulgaris subsp. vulgaris]|uniref:EH domain-containing protein 2-like n=1 Tax=Beta vulgaris subsp. vulgaris TaxID=3555 RepID=UPI0020368CEA|nr:EH domain-containing protein 2-like [Beta vulgaris subsp. vulgaris]